MEEKRILGMPKKVCLGLSYLVPVIGLIAFIVEYKYLDIEEKRLFVGAIVYLALCSALCALEVVWFIFALIAAINFFKGYLDYKPILFYNVSLWFIKDPI